MERGPGGATTMQRVILHVDMDAFYAAVEIRENSALAGLPLIVGHRGPRGVVTTCSYEARRYGVRSAMASVTAARLCPDAIWLPGRMTLYGQVSRRIHELLRAFSPRIEPLSIDEAFIDLTGCVADLAGGAASAAELKHRIVEAERLTASVGVAPNKFLAKLASDLDKPDGLTVLSAESLPSRVWPLPVERLWGVGRATAAPLHAQGLHTIGALVACEPARLAALVGPRLAAHLRAIGEGRDDRPVEADRTHRSISEERTYGRDLIDADEIDRELLARAEGVARQLRDGRLVASTVQIKVRKGDYTTWTRSATLAGPTDLAEDLLQAARRMFAERIRLDGAGVRLLGLAASALEPAGAGPASLLEDAAARRAARAADAVRGKLGPRSITRARLLPRK
jgi:DNA polymerase IV